jgi:hypothetical protein
MSAIKCEFCDSLFKDDMSYVSHLERRHNDMIPPDMVPYQFYYFQKTGRKHGACVICKKPTGWNEKTHKYKRFCDNPACKEKYKETFKNRMIGKYGKVTLLNDPEHQKKMLAGRKISGVYHWSEHRGEVPYTGTYELSFLEFMDTILDFDPSDIMSPSPHTYYYDYNGERHFYIPDFFIPSLNLEIEIKDGGDNPNMHHKIQDVDKVKEVLKDEVMRSNSNNFNYLKITNKENEKIFKFFDAVRERGLNNSNKPIFMI